MSAREAWLPSVSAAAIAARERLDQALTAYAERNLFPPCAVEPERWFALNVDAIDAAVAGCQRCPVLDACGQYAAADPRSAAAGIWAGRPDADQVAALARHRQVSA